MALMQPGQMAFADMTRAPQTQDDDPRLSRLVPSQAPNAPPPMKFRERWATGFCLGCSSLRYFFTHGLYRISFPSCLCSCLGPCICSSLIVVVGLVAVLGMYGAQSAYDGHNRYAWGRIESFLTGTTEVCLGLSLTFGWIIWTIHWMVSLWVFGYVSRVTELVVKGSPTATRRTRMLCWCNCRQSAWRFFGATLASTICLTLVVSIVIYLPMLFLGAIPFLGWILFSVLSVQFWGTLVGFFGLNVRSAAKNTGFLMRERRTTADVDISAFDHQPIRDEDDTASCSSRYVFGGLSFGVSHIAVMLGLGLCLGLIAWIPLIGIFIVPYVAVVAATRLEMKVAGSVAAQRLEDSSAIELLRQAALGIRGPAANTAAPSTTLYPPIVHAVAPLVQQPRLGFGERLLQQSRSSAHQAQAKGVFTPQQPTAPQMAPTSTARLPVPYPSWVGGVGVPRSVTATGSTGGGGAAVATVPASTDAQVVVPRASTMEVVSAVVVADPPAVQ